MDQKQPAIFNMRGRPVVKVGEVSIKSRKFGTFVMIHLAFIDGRQPVRGKMTRGDFDRLKPIRGSQAQVWHRVRQLVGEGMEPNRALTQATAEMAKGILTV